jgi:carbon monoxide dehydrogenase subunit G
VAAPEPLRLARARPFHGTVAAAWRALTDPATVWHCLPGAVVAPAGADLAEGRLKMRFGTLNPTFRATARVVERNARAHRVAIEVQADDARGAAGLTAHVVATAGRTGDRVVVRVEARVDLRGRPAELPRDKQRTALGAVIEQFLTRLTEVPSGGDDVAEHSADNPSGGADEPTAPPTEDAGGTTARKRPRPTPEAATQPGSEPRDDAPAPEPDVVPSTDVQDVDAEIEAVVQAAVEDAVGLGDAPAFGTPDTIPVPTLADEPSVNGHSVNGHSPGTSRAESPLARSTRQAMARRIAPVAVGLVFVLVAARRRRARQR